MEFIAKFFSFETPRAAGMPRKTYKLQVAQRVDGKIQTDMFKNI